MAVSKIEDMPKIMGSKYSESTITDVLPDIKENLDSGKKVLFSGVPCECAAVQEYLNKTYSNLFTCEVFCHGKPKIGVFTKYIDYLKHSNKNVLSFNFRSKLKGWSNPSYLIKTEKKEIIQEHSKNVYQLMFGYHLSLRRSCFDCQFRRIKRQSDISIGDFWGIGKYVPSLEGNKEGVSAVLVNTSKGADLLDGADVTIKSCPQKWIFDKNKCQIEQFEKPDKLDEYNDDYKHMTYKKFFDHYLFRFYLDKVKRKIFKNG